MSPQPEDTNPHGFMYSRSIISYQTIKPRTDAELYVTYMQNR